NEEKVPGDVKTEVEAALGDLKEKLKGEDTAAIREASEKVAATSQKLGQALYADAQGAQAAGGEGAQAGDAGAKADGGADDDVVDAEIVDDDKPKDGAA
ncbi:MAG TPA: molecular chaperone DnaK, partial [Streptomyces sp.]|nr:molecular chaperone DnaK [Streptomyces sp.]